MPRIAAELAGRTLGRPDQPALAEPPVPPAAETAAKGVRRRISKKREGKPDRPWEAPLNPDEFGEVQCRMRWTRQPLRRQLLKRPPLTKPRRNRSR